MTKAEVKISYDRIVRNATALKETVGDFYCVLKCDAYGHGAVKCVEALYDAGFTSFAVFSIDEAVKIKRRIGKADILILGRTAAGYSEYLVKYGFIQTVFSEEYAFELSPFSKGMRVHTELDSGMNRTGFKCGAEQIKKAFSCFKGELEGVYTHFHSADCADLKQTESELDGFLSRAKELEILLNKRLVKHSAASASALRLPRARLDKSRIGLALYGIFPENCQRTCFLKPAMSFNAPIIDIRYVKKGENIGYGCDVTASRNTVAATLAVGYALGLPRCVYKNFKPILNGKRIPFLGRICMDRCVIDITDIENARLYDTVELLGDAVSVCELAECAQTIPYEVFTMVGGCAKSI